MEIRMDLCQECYYYGGLLSSDRLKVLIMIEGVCFFHRIGYDMTIYRIY